MVGFEVEVSLNAQIGHSWTEKIRRSKRRSEYVRTERVRRWKRRSENVRYGRIVMV